MMKRKTVTRLFNYCQVFLIVLVLVLTVSSCNKDDFSDTDIFPMNIGNIWAYERNSYIWGYIEENGKEIYDYYLIDVGKFVQKIETYENIEGYTGYTIDKNEQITTLLNLDNKGNVTQTQFFQNKFVHSSILYKKHVKKDDFWTVKSICGYGAGDYSTWEIQYSCIATDTLITTSVGDFKCIGYKYRTFVPPSIGYAYVDYEEYFSGNMGLVKRIIYKNGGYSSYFQEWCVAYEEHILIGYKLKLNPHR